MLILIQTVLWLAVVGWLVGSYRERALVRNVPIALIVGVVTTVAVVVLNVLGVRAADDYILPVAIAGVGSFVHTIAVADGDGGRCRAYREGEPRGVVRCLVHRAHGAAVSAWRRVSS